MLFSEWSQVFLCSSVHAPFLLSLKNRSKRTNRNWYLRHFYYPQFLQFFGKIQVFVDLFIIIIIINVDENSVSV